MGQPKSKQICAISIGDDPKSGKPIIIRPDEVKYVAAWSDGRLDIMRENQICADRYDLPYEACADALDILEDHIDDRDNRFARLTVGAQDAPESTICVNVNHVNYVSIQTGEQAFFEVLGIPATPSECEKQRFLELLAKNDDGWLTLSEQGEGAYRTPEGTFLFRKAAIENIEPPIASQIPVLLKPNGYTVLVPCEKGTKQHVALNAQLAGDATVEQSQDFDSAPEAP